MANLAVSQNSGTGVSLSKIGSGSGREEHELLNGNILEQPARLIIQCSPVRNDDSDCSFKWAPGKQRFQESVRKKSVTF